MEEKWDNLTSLNIYDHKLHSPADKCCDDDTPGCAAAVSFGPLLTLVPPAAQPEGVEEQEQKVQGQTGEGHASQQQDRLGEQKLDH